MEAKKMDDLPVLPFEKILRFLSLEERIKARAVSRRWCKTIDRLKIKALCYSERRVGYASGMKRLVSGGFAHIISSPRFEPFFQAFSQSILSNLRQLRLNYLRLIAENGTALFRTLNSFGQLEVLELFHFNDYDCPNLKVEYELNLPMLNSIRLDQVHGIQKLVLNAPSLQKVKLWSCSSYLRLEIVHGDSIERLIICELEQTNVKSLASLKQLYIGSYSNVDSTLLFSLEQLREVHLYNFDYISKFFEQKQRYDRADLKIFYIGLGLNGPDDWPPMVVGVGYLSENVFDHLAKNHSRLADEIPLWDALTYSSIESVAPELAFNVVNRLTDLVRIFLHKSPVQDIERFLAFLKNFSNIVELIVNDDQPQELFDRLPEHCAVQTLMIRTATAADLGFLFRLKHLVMLRICNSIDVEFIRRVFEGLKSVSLFEFRYANKTVEIQIDNRKWFKVSLNYNEDVAKVQDLNAAIQFITKSRPERPIPIPFGLAF